MLSSNKNAADHQVPPIGGMSPVLANAYDYNTQEIGRLPGDVIVATALSGQDVWAMFEHAALWLRSNIARVNAINVFPVPDGDTGFNMSATLDAAVEAASPASTHAGVVMRAMERGALLGGRGNSGVILSQALAGMAASVEDLSELDGPALAAALCSGERSARLAITEPKQGTMLTVLADVAAAVSTCGPMGLREVLEVAVEAAIGAVARTPDLLPILREVGVVDSGGLGVQIILEGCLLSLEGNRLPPPVEVAESSLEITAAWAARYSTLPTAMGYCTEFLVHGVGLDLAAVTRALRPLGESILVVGGETVLRVHIHTADPGAALSIGIRYGGLDRIKIDNVDAQSRDLLNKQAAVSGPCVVAIARGDGFETLFRQYGAVVVQGGQAAKASTSEILDALEQTASAEVILLPNNPNQQATAEQAATLSKRAVTIVPTISMPQGIAALLAFNLDRPADENERNMREAASRVHTIELTPGARDVNTGGIRAVSDQPIGLLDGHKVAAGGSWTDVLLMSVSALDDGFQTAAIFYGIGVTTSEAEDLATVFRSHNAEVEVEIIRGGQEAYPFIIALE